MRDSFLRWTRHCFSGWTRTRLHTFTRPSAKITRRRLWNRHYGQQYAPPRLRIRRMRCTPMRASWCSSRFRMSFILQKEKQEAERKRIEAQGIADFQKIVAAGISPQLLEWKGIEATEKLAASSNAKVVIIGNPKNGLPLVLEPR